MLKQRIALLLVLLFAILLRASAKSNYWIKEGDKAVARQEIQLSITYYTKAIDDNPRLVLPYLKRAQAYRLAGQLKESAIDIRIAMSIDPRYVKAYSQRSKSPGI